MILEKWMVNNLRNFGNCLVDKKFVKKHGDEKIISEVKGLGFDYVFIVKTEHKKSRKPYLPGEDISTTYVIETNEYNVERTHMEVRKMQRKFNIGDKVEIINGTQKGKIGIVETSETNDCGEITYGLNVPSLKNLVGVVYKQGKDLKLEKAAKRKVGRPKKEVVLQPKPIVKKEPTIVKTKVEELKEVTKEAVEMFEKSAEVVEEPIEKSVEETKSSYDHLVEAYDIMRRTLNVTELEAFCDIVTKDVIDSKMVLEQMYQMSIAQLMKVRKQMG